MKPPLFVRTLTPQERQQLKAGLRSPEAFVLKRCQILLVSAHGQTVPQIAQSFGYAPNSIRHVLHAFNHEGLAALSRKSNRPKSAQPLLNEEKRQQLRHLLEQSPHASADLLGYLPSPRFSVLGVEREDGGSDTVLSTVKLPV